MGIVNPTIISLFEQIDKKISKLAKLLLRRVLQAF